MKLSVVVPFLNEEVYIEQCIRSLLGQDFDKNDYEIIFVDNGSTDRSSEIVRSFPQVILLREDKKYEYAARNRAFQVAKGDIIACTNADCAVARDWLKQIELGMRDPNVIIILGNVYFSPNCSILVKMVEDYENAKMEVVFAKYDPDYYFANANNMAIRTKAFKEVGQFTELHRAGDTGFLHKVISRYPRAKVLYLSEMMVRHLEILSVPIWLKKISVNARPNILIKRSSNYKPLGYWMKYGAYRYCIKKNNYNFRKKIVLFLLLVIGNIFYIKGELDGSIKYLLLRKY